LVLIDRPGVGDSTNHHYASISEWAPDALSVADQLGHERLASVGLSGGGPYALSLAAAAPERVKVVALLGSVCPIAGADAVPGTSIVSLAARFRHLIEPFRTASGVALWAAAQPLLPAAHVLYRVYSSRMPEGDRKVFADPDIEAMFVDDIVMASRRRFGAVVHDIALFGRPWGFALSDIDTPVLWWHGDADNIVPLADAEHAGSLLKRSELAVREAESHLGAFAVADVVLEAIVKTPD
jgi:pimeloyl-ACP methyl ester carboxylesterase